MSRTIQLFFERDFDEVQATILARMRAHINGEDQNYLLNVNVADYAAHVASRFLIDPLIVDFDGMEVSFSEQMIPAQRFPSGFNVFTGKSYPKQVVRYHIPFSGDANLLTYIPNPRVMNTISV